MTVRIAPSVLSADLGRLAEQIARAEAGGAEWIHVDVMDGHFVPNLTFGAPIILALARLTSLPIDVHLMVERPEQYISEYADLGTRVFSFHPEATVHVQRHLAAVRAAGMMAGLVLNPSTQVEVLNEVISDLDLVLVMSVNPGFGGQGYLPASTGKIARVRSLLASHGSEAVLEVDGGITVQTIGAARLAGADTFVAGNAVFGTDDPAASIQALLQAARSVG
ncbi:MAG TPA: ribulose-phosphate 3-epimerase [Gemmatimonadales bacterium]|nr:ribulose-phosphate 3-epimerase [Gemmatimonadales bacterium]